MRGQKTLDLALCGGAGAFYLTNRLWLRHVTAGGLRWFLVCYANDVMAGLAIVAWLDLLLRLGRLPPLRSWKQVVPFVLACSLVWEVLAPLWKAGAVCDPWDLLAYQAGGLCWLLAGRLAHTR